MHDQIRSSPSRPNPTSDGGLAEWTISKEQWDAYAEPMSKTMRSTTAVTVVAGTVVVSLCLGLPLTLVALLPMPLWLDLALVGVIGALGIIVMAFLVTGLRTSNRWSERLPALWDEKGCVCPICLSPLTQYADDRGNCGHGYIVEDQPLVVPYLEALATATPEERREGAVYGELDALRARARARGQATRVDFVDWILSIRRVWDDWFGFDRPLWRRIVAPVVLVVGVGAISYPIAGIYAIIFVWGFGFALTGWRAFAKAGYLLQQGKSGATRYKALGACCMFMAFVFPTTLAPVIGRNLPTEMLFTIGEKLPQATEDTFDVLASRPLSAQDQKRLADAMLPFIAEWARGGGTIDRTRHARHIANCLANGTLPADYHQRFVDALLLVDILLDGRGIDPNAGIVEIASGSTPTIALRFGGQSDAVNWRGRDHTIFSKVELDGATLWDGTAGAPVETASFAIADTSTAGDRTMVVRGWFALTRIFGNTTAGSIDAFDDAGRPALPEDAYGAWPIERKITLRIR